MAVSVPQGAAEWPLPLGQTIVEARRGRRKRVECPSCRPTTSLKGAAHLAPKRALRQPLSALALPPSKIGYFTWWSILDQRIGIWTTLAGPISVLAGAVFIEPLVLPAYISWVMFTRYAYCCILSFVRFQPFPISYPFLLYFSQIAGAAVKSFVLFRLDKQRWTRQSSASGVQSANLPLRARLKKLSSVYTHVLAIGWLTLGVAVLSGIV